MSSDPTLLTQNNRTPRVLNSPGQHAERCPWHPLQMFNWICELLCSTMLVFGGLQMTVRGNQLYEPWRGLFAVGLLP